MAFFTRYDVNNANTNREVRFRVEANGAADRDTGLFLALKGPATSYPHYGQVTGVPTANQELAQLRLSLIVRAVSVYAPPVAVYVGDDSAGTGVGSAVLITFETDESGVFFDNAWPLAPTGAKNKVTDIADTVGVGGMTTPKTKDGFQTLLNNLSTVSYDGGTTGPFGTLSASGAIVLPDGQVTSGAPALDNDVSPELAGVLGAYLAPTS